jgi:hypothetical protein
LTDSGPRRSPSAADVEATGPPARAGAAADIAPAALRAAQQRLTLRFGSSVPAPTIARVLEETYERFLARSTVTTYLPLLAERAAATRLRELADDTTTSDREPRS